MGKPIPVPGLAGEVMASSLKMGSRGRIRVIEPKPDLLESLGDNEPPTFAGKDSPRVRSWHELSWIAPVVVAAAHNDIQTAATHFLRIPAKGMVRAGLRWNSGVVGIEETVGLSRKCAIVVGFNVFDFKTWFEKFDELCKGAGALRRWDYRRQGYWRKRYLSSAYERQKT